MDHILSAFLSLPLSFSVSPRLHIELARKVLIMDIYSLVVMLSTTLFLVTALSVHVLALPMTHSGVHRRNHKLIKMSTKGTSSYNTLDLWTTASSVVSNPVKLAMTSFNPTALMSRARPTFSKAPDRSEAMRIHFKKGM